MKLTDEVKLPAGLNAGLQGTGNAYMLALLGNPRASYGFDCRPVTNPKLLKLMVTDSIGPFRVTGIRPAVESLKQVFADIKVAQPLAYAALGTAGMLCARLVRGNKTSISNHSWGTAVDFTINKVLDQRGDGMVQYGLAAVAPIFNKHGWYWGAMFGTEDAMHFECSRQLLAKWKAAGIL